MDYIKTAKGKILSLSKDDYPVKIYREDKVYRIDDYPKGLKMQSDGKVTATTPLEFTTSGYV